MQKLYTVRSLDEFLILLMLRGPRYLAEASKVLADHLPDDSPGSIDISTDVFIAAFSEGFITGNPMNKTAITWRGQRYIESKYPNVDLEQLLIALRI